MFTVKSMIQNIENKLPTTVRHAKSPRTPPTPPKATALTLPPVAADEFGAFSEPDVFELKKIGDEVEVTCVGTGTTAVDVQVVLDVSGSMGTESTVQDASGANQRHGFTILDVCKHACRALAATLDSGSRLGLVVFDSDSRVALPLDHVALPGR